MFKIKIINKIKSLNKTLKKTIVLISDLVIAFFSVWLSFSIRLEEYHNPNLIQLSYYFIIAVGFIPFFLNFNIYNYVFRYLNLHAIKNILKAIFIYSLMLTLLLFYLKINDIPRSIGIIQPVIFFLLIFIFRMFLVSLLNPRIRDDLGAKYLIYGAGVAGAEFLMGQSNNFYKNVFGYLDDDNEKQGRIIMGKNILDPKSLSSFIVKHKITDVLLCLPSVDINSRQNIIQKLINLNLKVSTVPNVTKIIENKHNISEFGPLGTLDIISRESYNNNHHHLNISNRTILIAGAGGSIGSEICRQILKQKIKHIILLDNSEYNLYKIDQEISLLKDKLNHKYKITSILASAREESRMEQVFKKFSPNIVFHAAAYKHVTLVEQNKIEALTNNYDSTVILSNLAIKYNVENFTFISTDKAVNPSNIMGTSKRLAEIFIQKVAAKKSKTIFSIVRFGNVIGSSGSLIPLFQNQIKNGGPLTVTHENVSRYFMTIPEAVDLVLSASYLASSGDVFILDMGEPIKIIDIAKKMIALSGKTEITEENKNGDIEIKIIGLKPGEKLHEELFLGNKVFKTSHPKILKVQEPVIDKISIVSLIKQFREAILLDDDNKIKAFYKKINNI